ncbi:MAG: hypothetical protein A2W90_21840 [Bacteroidetes bacterium GWF2_42_66]|nr:MAG: hypothetical protein A2W92_04655 [Bacteroidetes bacterium GWA2_42_15]OFY03266.1 MAG: hypothetical protein A2W89_19020 [Bacteroidetes bacterium GWE2_42_39]OFY45684.1 MAG: hypothetical protein A2W90_21840 [Bacteroidetes bacterium GWF2_42_66]HBL77329.1 hypothetical protein [Prolixibacteraceae bacterium]HCR91926.1 hypothetical protein [Prolixibacteraceae bacterium]
MIKKITAFVFIVLANFVLLVHAVIPHHHHQSHVCIENSHCQCDSETHSHCNPEHEHDGNDSNDCLLKQVVALPSNQVKQECKCICTDHHSHPDHSSFVLFNTGAEVSIPIFYFDTSIPIIVFSYPSLVITTAGLRAPPVA